MTAVILLALCLLASFVHPAWASGAAVADLALEPRIGAPLPMATALTDENGKPVTLRRFFDGKPVVLVLDYLRCRTICGLVLANLADAATRSSRVAARDYTVLAISIDPRDSPADAAAAKSKYSVSSWHFLTGPEDAVRPMAEAVGFHYRYDPASDQYIHSAGIVIAAPDGAVGTYLTDLDITPTALTAALDAVNLGRPADTFSRLLLLCFGQSAQRGRYTPIIEAAIICLNLAGILAACAMFAWVRRRRHD